MLHVCFGLQDSFSKEMEHIAALHEWVLMVLLGVLSVVVYLFVFIFKVSSPFMKLLSSEVVEILWTLGPIVVLVGLSFTSLHTLYLLEEVSSPDMTVNVTGHQWYWSYDSEAFTVGSYDSYLVGSESLGNAELRLLEVDKPLILPVGAEVRLLILSEDVIHSWAVPSLGVKIDGIPGRLNQVVVEPLRAGILYGQCSEMCGAYHSFMPINVECFVYYAW